MSTALILFGSMAVFLIIGVPIAFALGASVWATIVFSPDFTVTTGIIAQRISEDWSLHPSWLSRFLFLRGI